MRVRTTNEKDMERYLDGILANLKSILLKKHKDYGPYNIAHAPGGPLNGLRVRMYDKLSRINNLLEYNHDTPNYESIEDSFVDLANYAIIGLLVQKGQWEGLPSGKNKAQDHSAERLAGSISGPNRRQFSPEIYPRRKTR